MIKTAFVYGPYLMLAITLGAFVLRCRLGVRAQAIWTMVLLACFSKFFIYRELGGDAFNPEMSEHVIWVWNWAYSGAVILCALSVLTAFFRFRRRVVVLPLIAWSLAAWGVWNGIKPPMVREVALEYDDLPISLEDYRIVQLSDLHISSAARLWRTKRIVETANAATGDVIVITGDIVDGYPRSRMRDVMPLKNLHARDGVYAITGNHEKYYDFLAWRPYYERWGIPFLSNGCVFPHTGLAIGGVDDHAFHDLCDDDDYKAHCPNVVEAFAMATNGEFRVLLQHQPKDALENVRQHGVRLQLSGHTHGGIFPGMDYIVKKFNRDFVRGVYAFPGPSYLYVSPGAGQWAGFPIRFFNPTEITVFTLRRTLPVDATSTKTY